jgi:molecular chaperone GrpE
MMEDQHKKKKKPLHESMSVEDAKDSLPETEVKVEVKADQDIDALKKKLEEKEKEAKDNLDRFLRTAADLENYKKRAAREKEDYLKFANEDLIKAILPFIDNLERAVNHSEKVVDLQSLVAGVKLTIQQLLQSLNKFGLTSIESVGKPFDPAVHEAMMVVETDLHEPNHVVEEFHKGYLLHNRLIRPAGVAVSKPTPSGTFVTD